MTALERSVRRAVASPGTGEQARQPQVTARLLYEDSLLLDELAKRFGSSKSHAAEIILAAAIRDAWAVVEAEDRAK